jgi:uncharacterized membrane protein
LAGAWRRAIDFQGQSPFYFSLEWLMRNLFGSNEISLRFLSLLCGAVVVFLTDRISRRLSRDPLVPLMAIGFLLVSDGFQDAVLSARPYALGILFASWSILLVLQLQTTFSPLRAALFSMSLIATFYAHYLFILVLVVHLAVLVRDRRLLRALAPWLALVLIALVPGMFQLLWLSERISGISVVSLPNWVRFIKGAVPIPALVSSLRHLTILGALDVEKREDLDKLLELKMNTDVTEINELGCLLSKLPLSPKFSNTLHFHFLEIS